MEQMLRDYIAACDENIKSHKLIEDREERERAVRAQTLMKERFVAELEKLT